MFMPFMTQRSSPTSSLYYKIVTLAHIHGSMSKYLLSLLLEMSASEFDSQDFLFRLSMICHHQINFHMIDYPSIARGKKHQIDWSKIRCSSAILIIQEIIFQIRWVFLFLFYFFTLASPKLSYIHSVVFTVDMYIFIPVAVIQTGYSAAHWTIQWWFSDA